jgi:hypothetical protein
MIYDHLRLYVTKDDYVFEPALQESSESPRKEPCLILNRRTGEVMLSTRPGPAITREATIVTYGIIGIIQLHAGRFEFRSFQSLGYR